MPKTLDLKKMRLPRVKDVTRNSPPSSVCGEINAAALTARVTVEVNLETNLVSLGKRP
ncbi:MAG: hypothetical protein JOZ14_19715 [Acidobacteria bacterium]|nr:hypothetical protein [Acidobacteriota bacterium]